MYLNKPSSTAAVDALNCSVCQDSIEVVAIENKTTFTGDHEVVEIDNSDIYTRSEIYRLVDDSDVDATGGGPSAVFEYNLNADGDLMQCDVSTYLDRDIDLTVRPQDQINLWFTELCKAARHVKSNDSLARLVYNIKADFGLYERLEKVVYPSDVYAAADIFTADVILHPILYVTLARTQWTLEVQVSDGARSFKPVSDGGMYLYRAMRVGKFSPSSLIGALYDLCTTGVRRRDDMLNRNEITGAQTLLNVILTSPCCTLYMKNAALNLHCILDSYHRSVEPGNNVNYEALSRYGAAAARHAFSLYRSLVLSPDAPVDADQLISAYGLWDRTEHRDSTAEESRDAPAVTLSSPLIEHDYRDCGYSPVRSAKPRPRYKITTYGDGERKVRHYLVTSDPPRRYRIADSTCLRGICIFCDARPLYFRSRENPRD